MLLALTKLTMCTHLLTNIAVKQIVSYRKYYVCVLHMLLPPTHDSENHGTGHIAS